MLPTARVIKSASSSSCRRAYAAAAVPRVQKSFLERQRIKHNKKTFTVPQDKDAPYLYWPNIRLGNDPTINYEMSSYGVSPCGDNAYRNLHLRHLLMKTPGKVDEFKALHVEAKPPKNHKVYFYESPHTSFHLGQQVPSSAAGNFEKLLGNVSRYLTAEVPDLYLCDGHLGSHRLAQTNVRLITSDPAAALYLRHVLNSTADHVRSFKQQIYVLHAPGYVPGDHAKYGLSSDLDSFTSMMLLNGETIIDTLDKARVNRITADQRKDIISREAGLIVIGGTSSLPTLRSALNTLGDYIHLRDGRTPLNAHVVSHGKGAVVFDAEGDLLSTGLINHLFSAQNSVLSGDFAYRYFSGVTHSDLKAKRSYGDLVEKYSPEKGHVTHQLPNKDLFTALPKSVIFLVNDTTGAVPTLAKTTNAGAATKLYKAGFAGKTSNPYFIKDRLVVQPKENSLESAFENFLKTSNADSFVINVATAGKELDAIVKAVASGAAASAPVKPLSGIQLGAINKLDGVSEKTLASTENKSATKSLGEKLGISA